MNIFCNFKFIIEEMPYECIQGIVWQVCYQIRLMISANRSITISCNFLHLFSIVHQGGTSANAQRRPSVLVGPGGKCHPNFDRFHLFSSFFRILILYISSSICNKNGSSNDRSEIHFAMYLKSQKSRSGSQKGNLKGVDETKLWKKQKQRL